MPFYEYKDYSRELNSPIDEFKRIEALPNSIKEMAQLPPENIQIPERSKEIDPEPEINSIDGSSDNLSDTRENDRLENQDSKIDEGKRTGQGQSDNNNRINNTINNDNPTINSGLETAEAAETSVVSSSAALTGGVTVITAAAALVVAGVATSIMNAAPTIVSQNIVAGADYLAYEIDVRDLDYSNDNQDNKTQYKIRVHNSTFSMEFPIEEEGMQTQIVTGLTPFRMYTVSVVGTSMIGDVNYYNYPVFTSKLKKPQAAFAFTPKINYKDGLFDIEYKTYISDHYNTGSNTYLQVYVNDTLVVDDHDLPEDGFFKGVLTNMANGTKISAKAYTTYYDEEDTLIGEYGYTVVHPRDFISQQFLSPYTFNEDSFSSSFNPNEYSYNLEINTGFDNSDNPTEKYRIDLYNYGELIKSETTTSDKLQFTLDSKYSYVDVVMTEIMGDYEVSSKSIAYTMDPNLFDIEFRFFQDEETHISNDYYMEVSLNEDAFRETTPGGGKISFIGADVPENLTYKLTEYYLDGSEPASRTGNLSDAGGEGGSLQHKPLAKVTFEVFSGDKVISYHEYKDEDYSIEFGQVDVDDDGKLIIPYELDAKDFNLSFIMANFDGGYAEEYAYGTSGTIKVDTLNSKHLTDVILTLEGRYKDGTRTEVHVYAKDIDLDIKLVHDATYATYELSQLYGTVQLDTYLDVDGEEKLIDFDLGIQVYKYTSEYNSETGEYDLVYKYVSLEDYSHCLGMHYKISTIKESENGQTTRQYYKYKITAEDFDISNQEFEQDLDYNITELLANNSSVVYQYSVAVMPDKYDDYYKHISYVKTYNDDGTVNYYFYTDFENTSSSHCQRIFYVYNEGKDQATQDEGYNIANYTDYFIGKYYALENIEDRDYDFTLQILYENSDNIRYYLQDYKFREYDAKYVVDNSQSDIQLYDSDEDDVNDAKTISITIDYTAVDTSTLKINYNNVSYSIPFKDKNDSASSAIEEQGKVLGYRYTVENTGYTIGCEVYDNGYMRIGLLIANDTTPIDSSSLPTFEARVYPNIVGKIGTSKIKNYEQLDKGIITYEPFSISITEFTEDMVSFSPYLNDDGIVMQVSYGSSLDESNGETIRVIITDEDGKTLYAGNGSWGSVYASQIPPYSEKIKVKVIPIKTLESREIIMYEDMAIEKEYVVSSLEKNSSDIETYPVSTVWDDEYITTNGYIIEGLLIDQTEDYQNGNYTYTINVFEYAKDGDEPDTPTYSLTAEADRIYYETSTNISDVEKVRIEVIKNIYGYEILWQVIDYYNSGE